MILPAIKNKLNPKKENEKEELQRGELEEIEPSILSMYEVFISHIQEENLKKIFSRQVLYKEEGLDIFLKSMAGLYKDSSTINNNINLTMKMLFTLLCEKHPQVSIRAIDIFINLLNIIKSSSSMKISYDFSITDNILVKINEKLGDTIPKVRNKAVELYCFMLKQSFCDYNNLLNELTKTEQGKSKTSSKVILGRLGIFKGVFEEFDSAITDKRTDMNSFPFLAIASFVIENINHAKSEVRKDVREVCMKMNKIFGFKKLEPLFKKVDERELVKLQPDIPELDEIIKELEKNKPKVPQKRSRSTNQNNKSVEKNNKSVNRSLSNSNNSSCVYCGKTSQNFKNKGEYDKHVKEECVLFTNCTKCNENVMVKNYNSHLLSSCKHKDEYKLCKRCKEGILQIEYEQHIKDNRCNPAKNLNSNGRCGLCHKDIQPGDKGFQQHLVKDICQKQKRRDKVTFVNGT
jgi:hypothetical protein